MKILIYWKGHRIGNEPIEIDRIKLTEKKLYLWYKETKYEIYTSSITGFETIREEIKMDQEEKTIESHLNDLYYKLYKLMLESKIDMYSWSVYKNKLQDIRNDLNYLKKICQDNK